MAESPEPLPNKYHNNQTMKNITELLENWDETKGRLMLKFAMLTDSDVMLVAGEHNKMVDRLQIKLGKTREEIYELIAEL
jgi:hypothetical protein